jgi:UDP-glucose 4-epimerase
MRALVTGGAGFIGSTLVERLLAEDHTVDVVDDLSSGTLTNLAAARRDHPGQMSFHRLDVRSADLVELMLRRRPDVVYHLATRIGPGLAGVAPTGPELLEETSVNILGALQVIEGARVCEAAKVVFTSSGVAIYGTVGARDLPIKESSPQQPATPSGVAKKAIFDYLWSYRELHSLEFTALALATVYGPRQRSGGEGSVVATFAGRLVAGEVCTLDGGGRQTRDFVYVDDVVDALARAAQRGSGLLLNIGTGVETTVSHLYAVVAGIVGVDRDAVPGPARPGDVARSALDPARAEIHLGWRPWTSLEAGVAAVVDAL